MPTATVHVACLCAAWCRLCDDYQVVVRDIAQEYAALGASIQWHWIDIEDQAELVGDVEVDTFPTLVVLDGQQVRFAGAITPQPHTLRQLLRVHVLQASQDTVWSAVSAPIQALAQRLRRAQATQC
jgi:thioredoxin 1